ncbi:MAG: hypothetical protein D6689_15330, partial [Deltaproteobacteria bacterium]
MAGVLNSLVLAESEPRAREAVRFAFEREGIGVAAAESLDAVDAALRLGERQLVIVGERVSELSGVEAIERLRGGFRASGRPLPVIHIGDESARERAFAAGATVFVPRPAFARDVVVLARLLAARREGAGAPTFAGELRDLYGVQWLVRALGEARWDGVATLVRGLRRGELRLYRGEVTSAQVGVLHGIAALHQLLLWSDARVDVRVEEVVRRRQIPLSQAEIVADAERFLAAVRAEAGPLSPAQVWSFDANRLDGLPHPVVVVARLFDGARTVADVIEDSPYRVFETLRVAVRLAELGIIAPVDRSERADGARAALAIEEWQTTGAPIPGPVRCADSEPTGPVPGEPGAWASLLPVTEADLSGYAAVVPSVSAGGEITVARERLEDVTSPAERTELFGGGASVASELPAAGAPGGERGTEPTLRLRRDDLAAARDSGGAEEAAIAAAASGEAAAASEEPAAASGEAAAASEEATAASEEPAAASEAAAAASGAPAAASEA